MRWVGDRSYSFYLWHWPALVIAAAVWRTPSGWSGLLLAAAALVVSDLTYRFVENPFRTMTFFKPKWRGIALYPASVALLGLVVWGTHAQLVREASEPQAAITTSSYGQEDGEEAELSDDPSIAIVEASVLAAQNGQPIPNPLKPDALSLVETDDPVAADLGECEYFGIPDPMPLCPLGDADGDKTMVLVGDSHMRHWIPALSKIAEQQGYRAYYFVLQGCTPALVQPVTPLKDAPDEDCVFFHEWTQQQIEELRPDLVVMSTDTQFEYVDDEGERTEDNQEIAALIEQGMVDRIEATRSRYAGRIVVIGDVPRLKFDPERHHRARRHPRGRAVGPAGALDADAPCGQGGRGRHRDRLRRLQAVVLRLRQVPGRRRRLHHPPRPGAHDAGVRPDARRAAGPGAGPAA